MVQSVFVLSINCERDDSKSKTNVVFGNKTRSLSPSLCTAAPSLYTGYFPLNFPWSVFSLNIALDQSACEKLLICGKILFLDRV